jgi:methylenetetrahydrofolate dehydrogenase (NADP+) / methenyltetrahydrofolate cyclohydrolase
MSSRLPSGSARLMDGNLVARHLLVETGDRPSGFAARTGRRPVLAAVLVGEDPASET